MAETMRHEASGSIKVPTGELLPLLLFFNWALLSVNSSISEMPIPYSPILGAFCYSKSAAESATMK